MPETFDIEEKTIYELRAFLDRGLMTSKELVEMYIERIQVIDKRTPKLNSVIELTPMRLRLPKVWIVRRS